MKLLTTTILYKNKSISVVYTNAKYAYTFVFIYTKKIAEFKVYNASKSTNFYNL